MDDLGGKPGFQADTFSEGVSPKSFLGRRFHVGILPEFLVTWATIWCPFQTNHGNYGVKVPRNIHVTLVFLGIRC